MADIIKNKISIYRYERKAIINSISSRNIEDVLYVHPYLFSEIFEKRVINNIYFDNEELKNYHDNVEGSFDRLKYRIRWYGDRLKDISKGKFEIKIKKGDLGRKISFKLKRFSLGNNTDLIKLLKNNKEINDLIDVNSLVPTLYNSYSRKYFLSLNRNYRITIDSNQIYRMPIYGLGFGVGKIEDYNQIIFEIKYNQIIHQNAHHVSSFFPFRISKNSKYVNGIEKLYGVNR